jgi:hypothetical protein
VVILSARGLVILLEERKLSNTALKGVMAGFVLLQLGHIGLANILIRQHTAPFSTAAALAHHLRAGSYVVFFAGQNDGSVVATHFNRNGADWRRQGQVFLVDPGSDERGMWARRLADESGRLLVPLSSTRLGSSS